MVPHLIPIEWWSDQHRVICRYHSIYGSWKSIILVISGDATIISTCVAHKATYGE